MSEDHQASQARKTDVGFLKHMKDRVTEERCQRMRDILLNIYQACRIAVCVQQSQSEPKG